MYDLTKSDHTATPMGVGGHIVPLETTAPIDLQSTNWPETLYHTTQAPPENEGRA